MPCSALGAHTRRRTSDVVRHHTPVSRAHVRFDTSHTYRRMARKAQAPDYRWGTRAAPRDRTIRTRRMCNVPQTCCVDAGAALRTASGPRESGVEPRQCYIRVEAARRERRPGPWHAARQWHSRAAKVRIAPWPSNRSTNPRILDRALGEHSRGGASTIPERSNLCIVLPCLRPVKERPASPHASKGEELVA